MSAFAAAATQSATVGNVSTGNIVNATNSITHILNGAEEKKTTETFWWPLAVAFGSAVFPKI